MKHYSLPRFMAFVTIGAILNLGLGFVVSALRLPLYLDSTGTILATALGGLWAGILCGLFSAIVGSVHTPTLWAYTGTMLAIAIYTSLVRPFGYLSKLLPTALLGVGLGVVCAIISAPVTTYLWKGNSLSGTDSVTAFFMAKGWSPLLSVILGSLSTDPIDKLLTSLCAFALLKRVPSRLLAGQTESESANA
jgi:energy-coupling factor transport system substrate-specific component